MQSTFDEPESAIWTQIAPLLDTALAQLARKDHDAIVLRFFNGKSFKDVGAALGASEDGAKMRVHRTLQKLQRFFTKSGLVLSEDEIAKTVSVNSVQAAPAVLVKSVTTLAISKGATASGSTSTLIKGTLKLMAWAKAKTSLVVVVCAFLTAGTTTVVVKAINNRPGYYKGKSLSEWLVNLDDQHPGPANDAAEDAVRHIGIRALPTIISSLHMANPMRHNAVLACQLLGSEAKPAIPALMKLLNDGYARGYVGVAMARIGQDAISPLTEALTNENPLVRAEVARSLGRMPMYSGKTNLQMADAISVLVVCLADRSAFVRANAANSLGELKGEASTVIPTLIKSLDDRDKWTRWDACLALGQFGAQAEPAIPALLAKCHSDARGTAAIALVQIEPNNAARINSLMPILTENIEGIDGTNLNYRSTTAVALGSCGEMAKSSVPALLKAAQVTTGYEKQQIVNALKRIDLAAAADAGFK